MTHVTATRKFCKNRSPDWLDLRRRFVSPLVAPDLENFRRLRPEEVDIAFARDIGAGRRSVGSAAHEVRIPSADPGQAAPRSPRPPRGGPRGAPSHLFDSRERRWRDRSARSRRRSPVFTNGAMALQAASQASLPASRGVR
jgi:hypothetical protein